MPGVSSLEKFGFPSTVARNKFIHVSIKERGCILFFSSVLSFPESKLLATQGNARYEREDRKIDFQDHTVFSILKSQYTSLQVSERNAEIKI